MVDIDAIKTTLSLRKAIQGQTDQLICAAAINVARLRDTGMEKNQIRNVLNLAGNTESMEEITNFIRYQIGRKPKEWENFGRAVIQDIETGVIKTSLNAVLEKVPDAKRAQARAELTERYLGYLNRCFMYAKATGDWVNLSSEMATQGGKSDD